MKNTVRLIAVILLLVGLSPNSSRRLVVNLLRKKLFTTDELWKRKTYSHFCTQITHESAKKKTTEAHRILTQKYQKNRKC